MFLHTPPLVLAFQDIDFVPGNAPGPKLNTLNRSPKRNWVEKVGGLPHYIARIAKHLGTKMSLSHAIAIAINTVKKWCATGDITQFPGMQRINKGSRAQACAAVAEWEGKKAAAKLTLSESVTEETMGDKEAFELFGLSWPEELPEYWSNPKGSDQYMEKMGIMTEDNKEEKDGQEQEQQQEQRESDSPASDEQSDERSGDSPGTQEERSDDGSGDQSGEDEERSERRGEAGDGGSEAGSDEKSSIELAVSFSNTPWSNFTQSDYTPEQWRDACLVHLSDGGNEKEAYKLPIKEPSGKINWNAVQAAASRIDQLKDISASQITRAAKTLMSLYRQAGKSAPPNIRKAAGLAFAQDNMINSFRLPWELSQPEHVTKNLWWKQILPEGTIRYMGHAYEFTKERIDQMITNFKNGAYGNVPFVLTTSKTNEHPMGGDALELSRGEIIDLKRMRGKNGWGAYALIRTDSRAEMMLSNNNNVGVSPFIRFDVYRENDDKLFEGPVLVHVAATPEPRVEGMEPWQAVALSSADAGEIIDLSGEMYSELERKESDPLVADTVEQTKEVNEKVETELVLSNAEIQRALQLAESRASNAEKIAKESRDQLKTEQIDRELDTYRNEGVPPAVLELARPFLLEDNGEDESKLEYMQLSSSTAEDGSTSMVVNKVQSGRGDIIRKILNHMKGSIELSVSGGPKERGSEVVEEDKEPVAENGRTVEHNAAYTAYLKRIGVAEVK